MKNGLKVFKGNSLIEAKYKLTLAEQKFILFAISKIRQDDMNKVYEFHVKDFAAILDVPLKNSYRELRRLIKSIMSRPILFCPDPDTEIISSWFSFITYKRRRAIVSFEFASGLIPYLFNLNKRFTAYRLQNILQFRSVYSVRIYELLKQVEWAGERDIGIEELKEMLDIPNLYPLYANFKQKVLDIAKKELMAHSDMPFRYKEIKKGKKVVGVSFKLLRRRKK